MRQQLVARRCRGRNIRNGDEFDARPFANFDIQVVKQIDHGTAAHAAIKLYKECAGHGVPCLICRGGLQVPCLVRGTP